MLAIGAVSGQPEEIRVRALAVLQTAGRVQAVDLLGPDGVVIRDALPGHFQAHLASALGDVNGDGLGDLGVFWDAGFVDIVYERLYVIWGRRDAPERIDGTNIAQFATRFVHTGFGNFGASPRVYPAGDQDGDRFADFFVGDRTHTPPEYSGVTPNPDSTYKPGIVTLIYGSAEFPPVVDLADPPAGVRTVRFSSTKPNRTKLGEQVSVGGDLNGDGFADLVFEAPFAQMEDAAPGITEGPGRVYVLFGREGGYGGLVDLEEIGTSLPGVILHGDALGQGFGADSAFVGDVNGDGFDDLLLGVTRWMGTQPHPDHVILLYGRSSFPRRLSANEIVKGGYGVRFLRWVGSGELRQTFAPLGDVNGDGLADFVVGHVGELGGPPFGSVHVVLGQEFWSEEQAIESVSAARFTGESGSKIGRPVATMDYDGDGVRDLLIGANVPVDGVHDAGRAYVVRGPLPLVGDWPLDALWSGELEGTVVTTELPELLGCCVYDLGDFNGDGRADILVSGPYGYTSLPNHVEPGLSPDPSLYVVFGSGGEVIGLRVDDVRPAIAPLEGGTEIMLFGAGFDGSTVVAIAGKPAPVVRVETSARLLVRVPAGEELGPSPITVGRGGKAVRVEGLFRYVRPFYADVDAAELPAAGKGIVIRAGLGRVDQVDHYRAAAFDHDGDGYGDVVMDTVDGLVIAYGRPGYPQGGEISVLPGESPPEGTARLRLSDQERHEPFGIGDGNRDKRFDLAVLSERLVTVIFGGERFFGDLEVATLVETGRASVIYISELGKPALAGAGDFDGDRIGDFALSFSHPGKVYVVRGRSPWPPIRGLALEPVFWTMDESTAYRLSGALVGDVDGDGFSELLVGAPGYYWSDRGKAYLIFGKSDWKAETLEAISDSELVLEIESVKERDSLGFAVAGIGDFSGDGVPDLAISAETGSLEFAGESYVIFGSKDLRGRRLLELAELRSRGVRIRGEFGYDWAVDIAPAGDFNGDGRRDLLVSGGVLEGPDNPWPPRSYVVFGGAEGMLDLGNLGEHGFRILWRAEARSVGGTDFNGDGFDDVVVQSGGSVYVVFGSGAEVEFIRGDANGSRIVDLSDAVATLNYLFLGIAGVSCEDAADTNDDGRLNITDGVYLLGHLFLGTAPPPPPYPEPGTDPTPDDLLCPVRR